MSENFLYAMGVSMPRTFKIILTQHQYSLVLDAIVQKQRFWSEKLHSAQSQASRSIYKQKIIELNDLKVYLAEQMYGG